MPMMSPWKTIAAPTKPWTLKIVCRWCRRLALPTSTRRAPGPAGRLLGPFGRGLQRRLVAGEQPGAHAQAPRRDQVRPDARPDVEDLAGCDPLCGQRRQRLAEEPLRWFTTAHVAGKGHEVGP